jgi:nucleotide-binding universal stress UspA family protein
VTAAAERSSAATPAPGGPFRRVLVAWDGSADSVVALRTAAAIVGHGPGHVIALAVLTTPAGQEATDDGPTGAAAQVHRVQATFETARESIIKVNQVKIDLHTIQARHAPRPVCDYAAEHGFDLLVVGRHGDGGLIHPKLGHVAETAAKDCKIPVLLVSRD